MRICFTGDAIMLTPPEVKYWENNELLNIIKECDVRGSNLEMVLSSNQTFASTFCGGQWLTTTPDILNLLLRFEFDYFNTANNHTMDFSYKGMLLTNEALDKAGILHTGSGYSLEDASRPRFLTREGIRIAFVSCTASCNDAARAGNSSPCIPARPGVNMLRHTERLYVTPENMATIDSIANATCINARFLKSVRMGTHSINPEVHRLGRLEFVKGSENKKYTFCHKGDLKRIMTNIQAAKREAEIVVVNIHSHDIKGMSDDTADYYHEEFAHTCIDNGASVVVGTGTHQLKGIEVYKGCPIFYSLGNFIFKDEYMKYSPHDIYERYHVSDSITPEEFLNVRTQNGTVGLGLDPYNYRSVIPIMHYNEDGILQNLELVPIELGFEDSDKQKGFPYLADTAVRNEIFDRICRLSKEYGTSCEMVRERIRIDLIKGGQQEEL